MYGGEEASTNIRLAAGALVCVDDGLKMRSVAAAAKIDGRARRRLFEVEQYSSQYLMTEAVCLAQWRAAAACAFDTLVLKPKGYETGYERQIRSYRLTTDNYEYARGPASRVSFYPAKDFPTLTFAV